MTKQELIAILNELPDDIQLLHSSDDEGNHISELTAVGVSYTSEYTYASGYVEWALIHESDLPDYPDSVQALVFG